MKVTISQPRFFLYVQKPVVSHALSPLCMANHPLMQGCAGIQGSQLGLPSNLAPAKLFDWEHKAAFFIHFFFSDVVIWKFFICVFYFFGFLCVFYRQFFYVLLKQLSAWKVSQNGPEFSLIPKRCLFYEFSGTNCIFF